MSFKKIGIMSLLVFISGCGSRAVYLKGGTVCVLEKEASVTASVPGADGKLVPHTVVTLPVGTEFKYGKEPVK